MQTTSLRYFLAVVHGGSIAAASTRLNVASSAISRQIANLETELDCVLFERRPRGMVPSPAGDLLAQHATHILRRADQAAAEIVELRGLTRGLVRLATTEGLAIDLLPQIMAKFHARFPGIRFELSVLPPLRVSEVVAMGDADLGLTFGLGPVGEVKVVHELMVAMIGICARTHPLAGAVGVPFQSLRDYPVVLMPENTTSRQVFEAACRDVGIVIEPTVTANALSSILSFVKQTNALAPLASLSVSGPIQRGEFGCFSFQEPNRTSRIVQAQVMGDRELPRPVRIFLDELVAVLRNSAATPSS